MRIPISIRLLSIAAAIAMIAACAGADTSATALKPLSLHGGAQPLVVDIPNVSHHACPATGPIEYVSGDSTNLIDIYAGDFVGQQPCDQISWTFKQPSAFFVDVKTHDLYVANTAGFDILVFHRGATMPYNTYTDPDPNGQYPGSVVVASDGTVIACNFNASKGPEHGSLSTWIGGPSGGTFVGNFPMTDYGGGRFMAINSHDTIYYTDSEYLGPIVLWSVTCLAGRCGPQSQSVGVKFRDPYEMAFDADGDLVVDDTQPSLLETFELPNPNHTSSFAVTGAGLALDALGGHVFTVDGGIKPPAEYSYPSGTLIGTVPIGRGLGIAFDP